MVRINLAFVAAFALAACGGGTRYASGPSAPAVLFASGPIQQACQKAGRKAASRARCGCVQAVADQELSARDQKRGARYFSNPAALQDVRQSDASGNERFWKAWKAYGARAAELCRGT